MRVRKRLRRIKRLTLLGGAIAGVVAVRRAKARDARPALGPPATWPPLEPGEAPVAAVGDLVTAAGTPTAPGPPEAAPAAGQQPPAAPEQEPPFPPGDEPVAAVGEVASAGGAAWVAPVDGSCPATHPVKANGSSGIYHLPGGPFYARTRAQRCYADAAAAEADGYRAAKGS